MDGQPIEGFSDLIAQMSGADGSPVRLTVDRAGQSLELEVMPEKRETGFYLGVRHTHWDAVLALPREDAPGYAAGLRTGDQVVAVNGRPVLDEYAFKAALAEATGPKLEIAVDRLQGDAAPERVTAVIEDGGDGAWSRERLGAVEIDYMIQAAMISSAAKAAGLTTGDLPLTIDGKTVASAKEVEAAVQASNGQPLEITVLRRGQPVTVTAEPRKGSAPNAQGELVEAWRLGVTLTPTQVLGEERIVRELNPLLALQRGVVVTYDDLKTTLAGFYALFTRKIGLENLAGPIGIGAIAGETFHSSSLDFLRILCLISVNLAVINLLPIPILDGGHIIFALAEAVRGSPVGIRAREIAQTVGLSLILMLMGFAFWNDLSRHWSGFVKYFQDLL
jgi:regulator of sigma E protease